jgi:hypothetical protein
MASRLWMRIGALPALSVAALLADVSVFDQLAVQSAQGR